MEKEANKTSYGLWALLIKLGAKIVPFIGKLLKSVKAVKAGLAVASFASYAFLFTWEFAVIIIAMLFIHESGHVWAMRRRGIKTKGFYFIPLLGGAAVSEESFKTRDNEAYIAIMGPIWGLILSAAVLGMYYIWQSPILAAAAGWMALINLINLLPINPLDGGRIVKSIVLSLGLSSDKNRKGVIISLVIVSTILLVILALAGFWLFVIFGIIGLIEISREISKPSEMTPMTVNDRIRHFTLFLLVGLLLISVMSITKELPGADLAMEFLRG